MKKITLVLLFLISFLSYGQTGNLCNNPIIVSLPYLVTDNTSNYADANYEGAPGTNCGSSFGYLDGNDVVYSFTATFDGSIKIDLDTTSLYSGLFVYEDCAEIGVGCIGGGVNASAGGVTVNEFLVLNGVTYFFVVSTWALPQTMPYTLSVTENTCSNPIATFAVVSDCANGPQFLIDVNITSLGTATSVTLSDGTTPQVVSSLGSIQIGPFPNGTPIIVSLTNDQDASCVFRSSPQNLVGCPPVNDECTGATTLVVNSDLLCASVTAGTIAGATASTTSVTACFGAEDDDVWFSFVASQTSHAVSLRNVAGSTTDMFHSVWTGADCGNLTLVAGSCSDADASTASGLIIGNTYYIRVYTYIATANQSTTFNVCVGTPPPPPVNDVCSGAINLGLLTSPLSSTTVGAFNDNTPTCNATGNRPDIYYSIVVPNGSTLFIGQTVNNYDSAFNVFYGDCTTRTPISCVEDPDEQQVVWANLTGTSQTVYWIQDGYGTFSPGGTFTLQWSVLACSNAVATYALVSDCANGNQFKIDVNITNLGTATTLTVTDGTTPQVVSAIGTIQFGPYPNGTPKTITITNNQDTTCTTSSLPLNQLACPGPNNECSGALPLVVNSNLSCTNVTAGTVIGATGSATSTTACFGDENDDVWFSFVANQTTHFVSLLNIAGSTTDMFHSLWTGADCNTLTLVAGSCSDSNSSTQNGLIVGTTYYIRVYTYTALLNQTSTFNVCVGSSPPLPTNDNCASAIPLIVAANYAAGMVSSYNVGATLSPELPFPTTGIPPLNCGGFNFATTAKDIWYTITVPASGRFTVQTNNGVLIDDTALQLYSGTCAAFTAVGCNDDIGGGNNFSLLSVTGQTPGAVLYLRVFGFFGSSGAFELSAFDASLSATSFDASSFVAYPNPVKDKLNLSYSQNIDKVQVSNILGQEVFTKSINATNTEIDLSNLAAGTYLVKVSSNNQVKTIKVVKQ